MKAKRPGPAGPVAGPRAGRRRRHARPLLVRRREPHLARGAGAGGARRAHRGAPGRRGERRAQRGRAGRAGRACCRWSATTRPATRSRGWSRRSGVRASLHRDAALATTVKLRVIGRAAAAAAHRFRDLAQRTRCWPTSWPSSRRAWTTATWSFSPTTARAGSTHIERMIGLARAAGKPVLVDPKGDDYARYRGATLLTPNRAELARGRRAAGRTRPTSPPAPSSCARELGLDALLVTRSEEGMTLYRAGGVQHEPAQAREVFDVSGAGDTVIATLAVMLAAGADARRRHARGQPRRRHRGRQTRHRGRPSRRSSPPISPPHSEARIMRPTSSSPAPPASSAPTSSRR